jgi:hypothetical protein
MKLILGLIVNLTVIEGSLWGELGGLVRNIWSGGPEPAATPLKESATRDRRSIRLACLTKDYATIVRMVQEFIRVLGNAGLTSRLQGLIKGPIDVDKRFELYDSVKGIEIPPEKNDLVQRRTYLLQLMDCKQRVSDLESLDEFASELGEQERQLPYEDYIALLEGVMMLENIPENEMDLTMKHKRDKLLAQFNSLMKEGPAEASIPASQTPDNTLSYLETRIDFMRDLVVFGPKHPQMWSRHGSRFMDMMWQDIMKLSDAFLKNPLVEQESVFAEKLQQFMKNIDANLTIMDGMPASQFTSLERKVKLVEFAQKFWDKIRSLKLGLCQAYLKEFTQYIKSTENKDSLAKWLTENETTILAWIHDLSSLMDKYPTEGMRGRFNPVIALLQQYADLAES